MSRILWGLRALVYKIIFASFKFPSYLGKPIYVGGGKNISIGKRVRIFPGLRIETHNGGSITIEENVAIGQNVHITSSDKNLTISRGSVILANTFITNIDHIYEIIDKPILDQPYKISHTFIGENCFIGIGVAIQAGTTLGKQCVVGANSVVRGSFMDYSVIAGVPAKVIKRYDKNTQIWKKTNPDGTFLD